MRGKTLEEILDDFRAEARISPNAAHNRSVRDSQINLLQRTQEWLYEDFDWPHMGAERFLEAAAGQRHYGMPADMAIDRIQKVEFKFSGTYIPLLEGIDAAHYALYDSELDSRAWPSTRWRISEDEQIELWPIPSEDYDSTTKEGHVKLTGIKSLSAFVADADTADLDDRLISLFAASEYLIGKGDESGPHKLKVANKRYDKLRGNLTKRRVVRLFGPRVVNRRPPIAVYRSTS